LGTAPGLWLERQGKVVVLLPGPPHELKPMFDRLVLPRLEPLREGFLCRAVLKLAGVTESAVEDRMAGLYPRDPALKITTLARPGQIELHLRAFSESSPEDARARMKPLEDSLLAAFGEDVFSTGGEKLEEVVGNLLRSRRKTLACAESCTGGLIGHRLTNVPGSSEYFLGGMTVYSNAAKTKWLGVPEDALAESGAVSERTAAAMASGVRLAAGADFGLAVTGIAGPDGGTAEKPVGLVHAALAWDGGLETARSLFLGSRDLVKFQSSQMALDMLRRRLARSRP
jgi:nicotinamide-nucleotide amidase